MSDLLYSCRDCGKKQVKGFYWTRFDDYIEEDSNFKGIPICNECVTKETHKNRVKEDNENKQEQLNYYKDLSYRMF